MKVESSSPILMGWLVIVSVIAVTALCVGIAIGRCIR